MTPTEALAYIADLQAHPEVQLVNHRKLREAAAVLAGRADDAPLLELVANAELSAAAPAMAAALDCIVRRLQMDVDDGSRPDQWAMEDLIRTAKAALPSWWVIGAA